MQTKNYLLDFNAEGKSITEELQPLRRAIFPFKGQPLTRVCKELGIQTRKEIDGPIIEELSIIYTNSTTASGHFTVFMTGEHDPAEDDVWKALCESIAPHIRASLTVPGEKEECIWNC